MLEKFTEHSDKLKKLAEKVDLFVECTSFIMSKEEMSALNRKVVKFDSNVSVMDKHFSEINAGLYKLENDSDMVPCASQDPNEAIQAETFGEKKNLSLRAVKKTRIYLENPVYMESALKIASTNSVYVETSKFLREQWWAYIKTITKFFPEECDLPDPSDGLNCPPSETFEKLRLPLIKVLDKLSEKLQTKRLANVDVHDNIYYIFRDINQKYDELFQKTLWEDEEWLGMWGGFSQV